jgi:hypothetical protein
VVVEKPHAADEEQHRRQYGQQNAAAEAPPPKKGDPAPQNGEQSLDIPSGHEVFISQTGTFDRLLETRNTLKKQREKRRKRHLANIVPQTGKHNNQDHIKAKMLHLIYLHQNPIFDWPI